MRDEHEVFDFVQRVGIIFGTVVDVEFGDYRQ
jgi:hypothetical protein